MFGQKKDQNGCKSKDSVYRKAHERKNRTANNAQSKYLGKQTKAKVIQSPSVQAAAMSLPQQQKRKRKRKKNEDEHARVVVKCIAIMFFERSHIDAIGAIVRQNHDQVLEKVRIVPTIVHFEPVCSVKEIVVEVVVAAAIVIVDALEAVSEVNKKIANDVKQTMRTCEAP